MHAEAILKTVIGDVQDEWLDEPGNLDAWEGDPLAELKLDAKTRRILITHCVTVTTHTFDGGRLAPCGCCPARIRF